MRLTILTILLASAAACASPQDRSDVLLPESDEASARTADSTEPAAEPEQRGDEPIDLGIEGEYGTVTVDDDSSAPPDPASTKPTSSRTDEDYDWSCRVAADCKSRGLPRPKTMGEWKCTDKCVFVRTSEPIQLLE